MNISKYFFFIFVSLDISQSGKNRNLIEAASKSIRYVEFTNIIYEKAFPFMLYMYINIYAIYYGMQDYSKRRNVLCPVQSAMQR